MALEDYYTDPSQDCLARLFDAVNAMDISAAPILTRQEKLVMRASERKDIFAEKFMTHGQQQEQTFMPRHRPMNSTGSYSSFEEGILMRQNQGRSRAGTEASERPTFETPSMGRMRAGTESGLPIGTRQTSTSSASQHSPTDSSFTWVGDESVAESSAGSTLGRTTSNVTTDASSSSGHGHGRESTAREYVAYGGTTPTLPSSSDPQLRAGIKDTHFYNTTIDYRGHQLPIKMPLSTFPEEVGDVRVSAFCIMDAMLTRI